MTRLLIATTNQAKLAEYRMLLADYALKVLSLRDVGIHDEAPEDGASFAAIARIKAEYYFARAGIATLADDGGLEVDALDGAPGVRSHRWLGTDADDRALAEEIVRRMRGIDPARRTARLRAAAALIYDDAGTRRERIVEAALEGLIGDRCYPDVRPGFPYRAVLMLPARNCYLAELSEAEAAQLSQRRMLVDQLAQDLRRIVEPG
jgi:XTP/dITP diphosphohydrolase